MLSPSLLDLSGVFTDAEDDDATLTLSVTGNTDATLLTPMLDGTDLTLFHAVGVAGIADITVQAGR